MALGYSKPLYLLAFDHRGSFEHDLYGVSPPVSDEVHASIVAAKEIIYDGFVEAVRRGVAVDAAGILTDEEYGAGVARRALAEGHLLAMPVERSGQAEFQFEYGEDFGAHIEAFDPTFVKVLVRYNPGGDAALNARQSKHLARLSTWLHERGRLFLFELLVPATPGQLSAVGGDERRYDAETRPTLVVQTIEALQRGGVEPDIWKVEGLDRAEDCARVVATARAGGRDGVVCIVLGHGADEARVLEWLRVASAVPGFDGFAVGRTIWEDALRQFIAGTATRQETVEQIAQRYVETFDGYTGAS
jgi:myo-inositol catabolism protein IolC